MPIASITVSETQFSEAISSILLRCLEVSFSTARKTSGSFFFKSSYSLIRLLLFWIYELPFIILQYETFVNNSFLTKSIIEILCLLCIYKYISFKSNLFTLYLKLYSIIHNCDIMNFWRFFPSGKEIGHFRTIKNDKSRTYD